MRIPDEIRKCVAFLEYQDPEGYQPVGTVFFVTMSNPDRPDYSFRYAVTAGHVIKKIEERPTGNSIYLRLNHRVSGVLRISTWSDNWYFHPTDDVDVAVMPISFDDSVDWLFLSVEAFALDKTIKETEITVGDDVFLTG